MHTLCEVSVPSNMLSAGFRFVGQAWASLLVLSLVLSYVILPLCLVPIACLLCCSWLMLTARVAAKSIWDKDSVGRLAQLRVKASWTVFCLENFHRAGVSWLYVWSSQPPSRGWGMLSQKKIGCLDPLRLILSHIMAFWGY